MIARVSRYTLVGNNESWESRAKTMAALHEEMPGLQAALSLRDGKHLLAISIWDDPEIMDTMELERLTMRDEMKDIAEHIDTNVYEIVATKNVG